MRTADRNEDGLTLIELLVTMGIFAIVTLMLFTFMNGVTNVTARTDRHVQAEQSAQLALRRMTQDIRAANPIVDAAGCTGATAAGGFGECIRFDVPRPSEFTKPCVGTRVAYKLNRTAGRITREATNYTWNTSTSACDPGPTTVGVVLDQLNYASSTAAFTYTNKAGTALTTAADIIRKPSAGGTAAVKIDLVIRYQTRNTPDLVLSSNAVLRNNR